MKPVDTFDINGDDDSGERGERGGMQFWICALSAISGFLFGYDLCVMVIALPLIQAVRFVFLPPKDISAVD